MLNYDYERCNLKSPITIALCVVSILTISDFFLFLSLSLYSYALVLLSSCPSNTFNRSIDFLLKILKIFLSMRLDFHTPGEKPENIPKTKRFFKFFINNYRAIRFVHAVILSFFGFYNNHNNGLWFNIVRRHSFHFNAQATTV